MPNAIAKDGVPKPRRSAQETKAENTTRVAMGMIEAEAASRDAKTAKLREARLAREEAAEQEQRAAAPARKKTARPASRAASK